MQAAVVRSGLTEARHEVVAAAVDADGVVIGTLGTDLERTFFLRSALKPFQAAVSQEHGAGLSGESLAVACASHGAFPVHVAYVREMLAGVGLDEDALRCPPDRPSAPAADRVAAAAGDLAARRVFHNCSGKHAGMLRACVASDWPLEYLPEAHPLQRHVVQLAAEVTRGAAEPLGVDGCGVPTVRSTVVGLAHAFSRLAADSSFAEVWTAMARFTPLTSNGRGGHEALAQWIPSAVKGGAQGCLGLAWYGGVGIAAKAWTGSDLAASMAVVELADRLGIVSDVPRSHLEGVRRPPVYGGGGVVGVVDLEPA